MLNPALKFSKDKAKKRKNSFVKKRDLVLVAHSPFNNWRENKPRSSFGNLRRPESCPQENQNENRLSNPFNGNNNIEEEITPLYISVQSPRCQSRTFGQNLFWKRQSTVFENQTRNHIPRLNSQEFIFIKSTQIATQWQQFPYPRSPNSAQRWLRTNNTRTKEINAKKGE